MNAIVLFTLINTVIKIQIKLFIGFVAIGPNRS